LKKHFFPISFTAILTLSWGHHGRREASHAPSRRSPWKKHEKKENRKKGIIKIRKTKTLSAHDAKKRLDSRMSSQDDKIERKQRSKLTNAQ